jgi:hypothetical protein
VRLENCSADRALTTVPVIMLVAQVKLRKRLDLDRDASAAQAQIPGAIVAHWVEGKIG